MWIDLVVSMSQLFFFLTIQFESSSLASLDKLELSLFEGLA